MDLPRLTITQRPNILGVEIKKPKMSLETERSTLDIKQKTGDLQIKKDMVKVDVDSYPARYDLGIKNSADMVKEMAQQGREASLTAVGRYVRQGDQLMKLENGGKPLIRQVKEALNSDRKEIGYRWKRGPKISVKSSKLQMKYKPNYPAVKYKLGDVRGNLDWGKVKISLARGEKFDIEVTGNRINRLV